MTKTSMTELDARQRVVIAAADLLAQHGLNGSSIREVVKHADAPFGSTYHHFPGGKQQIVAEAVAYSAAQIADRLEQLLALGIHDGFAGFIAMWRQALLKSNFSRGCPVMAAAVEEPVDGSSAQVLSAADQAFVTWRGMLSRTLQQADVAPAQADATALLCLSAIEGAIVMCRAAQQIEPFDLVTAQLQQLLKQLLAEKNQGLMSP